jgi:putative FmdB family regulatory protein
MPWLQLRPSKPRPECLFVSDRISSDILFCAKIDENQIHNPLGLKAMSKGGAMPLYEFYCEKCEKSYTLHLRLADLEKENYQCPKCKNRKIKKQISTFQTKTSKKS